MCRAILTCANTWDDSSTFRSLGLLYSRCIARDRQVARLGQLCSRRRFLDADGLPFRVTHVPKLVGRYRYHDEQRDVQRARIARDWVAAVDHLMSTNTLTRRQRRFARMGNALARYRYAPPGAWASRTRSLYEALIANPTALFDARFPKRELFPGREPLWRWLSHVKRTLGFKPRTC